MKPPILQSILIGTGFWLFVSVVVFFCLPSRPPAPPQLVLHLTAKSPVVQEDAPLNVTATIENVGETPAVLVLPGDGSSEGWRTPMVKWSVLPVRMAGTGHTPPPKERQSRKCGNLDPMYFDSIVAIRPGERREIDTMSIYDGAGNPGKYRIVFYYQNDPMREWGDPHSIDALLLNEVQQSTPCQLMSNEIVLTVKR